MGLLKGFDVMEPEMIESTNKVISFFCLPLPSSGAAWGCRKIPISVCLTFLLHSPSLQNIGRFNYIIQIKKCNHYYIEKEIMNKRNY
jgi:hypothetical protein